MIYDEDLAQRIRALVATERAVPEKKMFCGLAFLVGGNMAIAASGQGGILVRVGPERSDHLVATSTGLGSGDAGATDARLAPGGPRECQDQETAGQMGRARGRLRSIAAGEGIVLPPK